MADQDVVTFVRHLLDAPGQALADGAKVVECGGITKGAGLQPFGFEARQHGQGRQRDAAHAVDEKGLHA